MAPIGVMAMQVSASISMVATTYIIYTIVRMKLNNKLFLKLVLYIAICDFWSAAAVVVGGTRSESVACYIQSIMNNYFCLASILWTMVIGYEVHLLVWYNHVESDLRLFSIINWTLPMILSIVPLSTSNYGNDDGAPGWCYFNTQPGYPVWLGALYMGIYRLLCMGIFKYNLFTLCCYARYL